MLNRGFPILFAIVLFYAGGALSAESENDRVKDRSQTWGDPEDDVEPERGWTWFGMGYEDRARASVRAADGQGGDANGPVGGQAKGRSK